MYLSSGKMKPAAAAGRGVSWFAARGPPLTMFQLLAATSGIPNVAVDAGLVEALRLHDGKKVVLAVGRSASFSSRRRPRWTPPSAAKPLRPRER